MTLPTANALEIDRALQQTERLGTSGTVAFHDGLAAALDLVAPSAGKRARRERPRARPVVAIAGDGSGEPFRRRSEDGGATRGRELAERARAAGVRVHVFALAGHAEEFAPAARHLAQHTHGSLRRVPASAQGNDFFAAVRLPVPRLVTIYNPRTDATTQARLDDAGRFRAAVPMQAGENPLRIVATTTGHAQAERHWTVRYDASAARDAFLDAERERIRRVRARKNLELTPIEGSPPPGPSAIPLPSALRD